MLQQTQTGAVSEKFLKFIDLFPDFLSLSQASLEEVLKAWHGLGYNRRAVALKRIAEMIVNDYNGNLPDSVDELKLFPQIGPNTASSIVAFAFNKPTIFVETNIRRVYIYFFFPQNNNISDKEILPLVEKTLDKSNPREWYYALMDYGVMLKKTHPELNKKSARYRRQAPFKGSNRQIRGEILKLLLNKTSLDALEIGKILNINAEKIKEILNQLEKEGFIEKKENTIVISKHTF
jgi:A/G-specific adenine glycosylase